MNKGCLVAAALMVAVPFVLWNVPVSTTERGNIVRIGDYLTVLFAQSPKQDAERPAQEGTKITLSLFEELQPGVTREETVRPLLEEGELVGVTNIGGIQSTNYIVRNPDGSSAMLIFQSGVLVSKNQRNLQ